MSELGAYLELGFRHIVSAGAADHILFLLVLAAIYRPRDWRSLAWVVTAFTVGHSITLALAITGMLVLPSAWIEFLIPVTIVATAVENLASRARTAGDAGGAAARSSVRRRPLVALLFGLVHGAGFAGYLRALLVDDLAVPLLGFNLGVEAGQLLVLAAVAALFMAADSGLARLDWVRRLRVAPFQLRMTAVSSVIALVAAGWAWERWP